MEFIKLGTIEDITKDLVREGSDLESFFNTAFKKSEAKALAFLPTEEWNGDMTKTRCSYLYTGAPIEFCFCSTCDVLDVKDMTDLMTVKATENSIYLLMKVLTVGNKVFYCLFNDTMPYTNSGTDTTNALNFIESNIDDINEYLNLLKKQLNELGK